ncbi:hypothetical protein SAMN05428949_5351 [Chitinophaga sp. YR627]|jgi:hypothetical protein|uniref:hypothetical protein n=1 Tax=Chitinophaga sp. YR627 TaxID=1881041 RepID=UPI0008E9C59F|nr:hypothetical protein [Chitinophaga sp. YR627]SFO48483.1 hypothetical protein SAMN05428949_5351 [Chitinophaga sp. YR627]
METTHEIKIISVDYNSPEMPDAVKKYKPVMLQDGNEYCCFIGERPEYGIYGCGETPELAIMHWNQKYLQKTVEGALFSTKKPILEQVDNTEIVKAYRYRSVSN